MHLENEKPLSAAKRRESLLSAANIPFSRDVRILQNLLQHAARQKVFLVCKPQPIQASKRCTRHTPRNSSTRHFRRLNKSRSQISRPLNWLFIPTWLRKHGALKPAMTPRPRDCDRCEFVADWHGPLRAQRSCWECQHEPHRLQPSRRLHAGLQ